MSKTILAPDDGKFPVAYTRKRLIDAGFIRNTGDLTYLIRHEGFPAPIKRKPGVMQSSVEFHGPSVRHWWAERVKKNAAS